MNKSAGNDAFGQELLAFLNGKGSYQIIQRDDNYYQVSEAAKMYFLDYEYWPNVEKRALKYARGKILNIGSGAGRVELYLQKKGLNVIGIDASPFAIKVCKKRGVKKAKVLDIRNIGQLNGLFDTIILFGNDLGLLGENKEASRVLKKLYKISSKNAIIIGETTDPKAIPEFKDYFIRNKERNKMYGYIRMRIIFEKTKGKWFNYPLYSKNDVKRMILHTGWVVKKYIDSNNGTYVTILTKN